jgi:ribosomal protein L11 methyltransferase
MTTGSQYTTVGTFDIAVNPGRIQIQTIPASAQAVADQIAERLALSDVAVGLTDIGGRRWRVEIHFADAAEKDAVREAVLAAAGAEAAAELKFGAVDAADWVRQSLAGLQPVAAGRFVVHGAHDRARVPPNRIGIEIEAALAFGTGHHGTTRGCLLALDAICKRTRRAPMRVLDVGTGSGVLAMAAARALHAPVLATDIDAFAVQAARANVRHNRAGDLVAVLRADGVGARTIRTWAPYDLIFANILLGPLKRIATSLRGLVAPGGRLVLSGILPAQANAVIAAYRPLALQSRLDVDGWTTLVLVRGARGGRANAKGAAA